MHLVDVAARAGMIPMLLHVPEVLSAEQVRAFRERLEAAARRALELDPNHPGAMHVLGRQSQWNAEAARLGLEIAARTKDYEGRFANPFVAAEKGFIDEVIMPHSTRRRVARAFAALRENGFDVRLMHQVPCNDAGISYGQIVEYQSRV